MFKFIPKNENFYEFFDRAANNIVSGARVLVELFENPEGIEEKVKTIKDFEHVGDQITHDTVKMLNSTFITPIDREDIHALVMGLDDVMDLIDSVASRYHLYKIKETSPEAKELASILLKAAEETVRALTYLEKFDHTINHICIEINSLENEADRVVRNAVARLFDEEKDPITLIKWKEIYETLEEAADMFEDVANILEAIIVKHG
ncbi:MAG: DUF47 family protein [Thermodesulfobacteriota bacterium]